MRILVVDDDEAIRDTLDVVLRSVHHEVLLARSADEALRLLQANAGIDVALLDVKMPGRDGIEALPDLLRARPELAVVMMSAHGTLETVAEAMRAGALDFLPKPFARDELLARLVKVQQDRKQKAEVARLRRQLSDTSQRMAGSSPAIEGLRQVVARLAATPARVLIEGENGAGKELVARLLHDLSPRASGPFVDVNCAAIPKELLESELFGHEKGAFTGATALRKGKFEQADGGTLFLDEVGDMPLDAQAKVLRVIEQQQVQRVGGNEPIRVDVRLVAATNKDLKAAVADGSFREDLYYRLA
ncbi:MAG: sigma-54-dependent transcriptional regulator, partial [Planctomycetia bacterium]